MKKALGKAISGRADFNSFQMQNEKGGRCMYIISSFYSLSTGFLPKRRGRSECHLKDLDGAINLP